MPGDQLPISGQDVQNVLNVNLLDKLRMVRQGLDPSNPDHVQQFRQSQMQPPGYAHGGEVQRFADGGVALSPEEFQQHLQQLQAQGNKLTGVNFDDQGVKGTTPANLDQVTDAGNPEDEDTENKYLAEDTKASEDVDDDEDREVASDDKNDSDEDSESGEQAAQPRNLEGMTLNKDEALTENPQSPTLQIPEKDSLGGLLAALKPQHNSLKEAQDQRDQNLAMNQMARGAAIMGAGMAKADPSLVLKGVDQDRQLANMPVQKYNEQIENQQHDPNSTMSQVTRAYLEQKGIKVPPGASAADLFKIAPMLQKDQVLQQKIQEMIYKQDQMNNRAKAAAEARAAEGEKNRASGEKRAKMLADARREGVGGANDRKLQSRFDLYAKALREGGDQSVKLARQNVIRSQNLFLTNGVDPNIKPEDIAKIPDSQLNKVNRIQVVENGVELNRLLSGSNMGAQTTLDKLIPKNIQMDSTKVLDYINNNLNPANQAQALKAYMKIAARARDLNRGVVSNYHKMTLPAAKAVFDHFPDQAQALKDELKAQGYDVDPTKTTGGDTVTVTRKSDGMTKVLSKDAAQKYTNNPDFEVK